MLVDSTHSREDEVSCEYAAVAIDSLPVSVSVSVPVAVAGRDRRAALHSLMSSSFSSAATTSSSPSSSSLFYPSSSISTSTSTSSSTCTTPSTRTYTAKRKRQTSLLDVNTVEDEAVTPETTTTTAKADNDVDAGTLWEPQSLRLNVFEKFLRHFVHIFNDHDSMSMLYLVFYPCCSPNLSNILRHWSRSNPLLPPTTNALGWYNYQELHGFGDIVDHCRVAFCMNPDLTTIIRSVKVLPSVNGDTKAIMTFEAAGTSVIPIPQVVVRALSSVSSPKWVDIQRCVSNLYKSNFRISNPLSLISNEVPNLVSSLPPTTSGNSVDPSCCPNMRRSGDTMLIDVLYEGYFIAHFDASGKVYRMESHYFEQNPTASSTC